jgi:hypothetical protein
MKRKESKHVWSREEDPHQAVHPQRDCRILKADPDVEVPWNYLGDGFWRAESVCTFETFAEPMVDDRVRLDPRDPATARHLGQCEYASETDPAVLRFVPKVKEGADGGYRWVECGSCECGWQVPHYAESVG